MKHTPSIFCILCLLLAGCASKGQAYRLILVEKHRDLYSLHTGETCEPSGYDVESKEYKDNVTTAELWITYANCDAKEKIILDDRTAPMWGVPPKETPKPKGSVGVQ